MIQCPSCRNPMEEKISRGITIDQCKSCQGLWFDKDELLAFCVMSDHDKSLVENALKHIEYFADPKGTFCPKCKTIKLVDTRTSSMHILYCNKCQGLYISNHEIQRLLIDLNSKKNTMKTRLQRDSFSGGILGFGLDDLLSEIFDL